MTELQKLKDSSFARTIAKTLVGVPVAMAVITTGVGAAVHHREAQGAQYEVQRTEKLAENGVFDILRLSQDAPSDLSALRGKLEHKREAIDKAISDLGIARKALGLDGGKHEQSVAYTKLIDSVQAKINDLEATDWRPSRELADRSTAERELDDVMLSGAKDLYSTFQVVKPFRQL